MLAMRHDSHLRTVPGDNRRVQKLQGPDYIGAFQPEDQHCRYAKGHTPPLSRGVHAVTVTQHRFICCDVPAHESFTWRPVVSQLGPMALERATSLMVRCPPGSVGSLLKPCTRVLTYLRARHHSHPLRPQRHDNVHASRGSPEAPARALTDCNFLSLQVSQQLAAAHVTERAW